MPTIQEELNALQKIDDLLVSSPNSSLHQLLQKLLPRLIKLTENNDLRSYVLKILSHILKRIKSYNTVLPCKELLDMLSPINTSPFVLNFSYTFLEHGIKQEPRDRKPDCVVSLLAALSRFDHFSVMSNNLCQYIIPLIDGFKSENVRQYIEQNINYSKVALNIVGDYVLDMCLLTPHALAQPIGKNVEHNGDGARGVFKEGVGSISPGLSKQRMERVMGAKVDFLAESDILKNKALILHSYDIQAEMGAGEGMEIAGENSGQSGSEDNTVSGQVSMVMGLLRLIPPHFILIVLNVLSCDKDSKISSSAVEKLNGIRTVLYAMDVDKISTSLVWLLTEYFSSNYSNRSRMADDVLVSVMTWLCKDILSLPGDLRIGKQSADTSTTVASTNTISVYDTANEILPTVLTCLFNYYFESRPDINDGTSFEAPVLTTMSRSHAHLTKNYWILLDKTLDKVANSIKSRVHIALGMSASHDANNNYHGLMTSASSKIPDGPTVLLKSLLGCMKCMAVSLQKQHLDEWSMEGVDIHCRKVCFVL